MKEFEQQLATEFAGRNVVHRQSVDSTMPLAAELAAAGAPHGTLVLAEEQTAGRGRRGRSFASPSGENLYFTLVLRLNPAQLKPLPLVVPLAVCLAAVKQGVDARIKWPNDIWVGERKLSGMLIDVDGEVAFPGIGINVNGDPTLNPELREIATSFHRELGRRVRREELLADICDALEQAISMGAGELHDAYAERSMVVGRRVRVSPVGGAGPYEGIADRIEGDGTLVVARGDGSESRATAADVSVRPAD